jgi:hypothetical protein
MTGSFKLNYTNPTEDEYARARLRYHAESGGYTVMDGERFIGRVRRSRRSYEHSNGRTYWFWAWAAFPISGDATFRHRTRSEAGKALHRAILGGRG